MWSCRRNPEGSSPRVRGKRISRIPRISGPGLIPARAGKTDLAYPPDLGAGAHPRACGENRLSCASTPVGSGSSPRVRGKHRRRPVRQQRRRLIPARAGKTSLRRAAMRSCSAHPRACGENAHDVSAPVDPRGSSPRVRGKLPGSAMSMRCPGLIPARAGKTGVDASLHERHRAHPRACGENRWGRSWRARAWGSSPRVRGKRPCDEASPLQDGLIPARAGKTRLYQSHSTHLGAHPRACGENERLIDEHVARRGSSPRVRGKPHRASSPPF